ncbi:MAG: amidase [Beijerinckiaceae bacterium]
MSVQNPAATGIVMMDAVALSKAIHKRIVSCREVMEAYLTHIERLNPAYNAIVSLQDRDGLLRQAEAADASLSAGQSRGWMHGLPHAVKDLANTKGIRTTSGSPIAANFVPEEDAIFVDRIRKAGAILVGKTNVPEFGMGSQSYNPVFGTTLNAYDPTRTAGGSSGGAAVGLALRMLPVADGSDFGGSLRNPSGWNNIAGFRPTPGMVPAGPNLEVYLSQLPTDGPMARNIPDLAMLMSVMAGPHDSQPLSINIKADAFTGALDRNLKGVRIGWLGGYLRQLPLEDGVYETCLASTRTLEQAGCNVDDIDLPVSRDHIWQTWLLWRHWLISGKMAELYENPALRAQLKPEVIWEIEGGLTLSAHDVYRGAKMRTQLHQSLNKLFQDYDFIVIPTAQAFPFAKELPWPRTLGGAAMDTYHRWMEVTFLATLAGCPVAAVPAGFGGANKLPIGLQLIGKPQHDFAVMQLAHAHDQINGWSKSLPPALASQSRFLATKSTKD